MQPGRAGGCTCAPLATQTLSSRALSGMCRSPPRSEGLSGGVLGSLAGGNVAPELLRGQGWGTQQCSPPAPCQPTAAAPAQQGHTWGLRKHKCCLHTSVLTQGTREQKEKKYRKSRRWRSSCLKQSAKDRAQPTAPCGEQRAHSPQSLHHGTAQSIKQ